MESADTPTVTELSALCDRATTFFNRSHDVLEPVLNSFWVDSKDYYWRNLTPELQAEAEELTAKLVTVVKPIARRCKTSVLTNDADRQDVLLRLRVMRSALHLRAYEYTEPDAIHDEGTVLGFRPASQREGDALTPHIAGNKFRNAIKDLIRTLQICDPDVSDQGEESGRADAAKYRPNTAFIMMWMDKKVGDLEDVRDAVQEVFKEFDIAAIRADDIEHEGVITQRILSEIRTSEFLFADLTGMRPNVYYEVGFAHALGKRVILFRKRNTEMHFDLAGYNCPEYENLRDLKDKLRKRLEHVTNKSSLG